MNTPERGSWYAPNAETTLRLLHELRTQQDPTPTIANVLYPATVHLIYGEPDAGKSLFCAALAAQALNRDEHVLWLDYEQGWRRVLRRMLAFGSTDHQLAHQLHRIHNPHGPPHPETIQAYEGTTLVIADAFTGMLRATNGSSNNDTEVEAVFHAFLRPFAEQGASVAAIDHVPKDRETRGRWAIGSQRKLGSTDVGLTFEAIGRFKIGHTNRAKIGIAKDRDGNIHPAEFILQPNMTWTIETRTQSEGEFRPTALMERISRYLEAQTTPASGRTIEDDVDGSRDWKRVALKALINESYVAAKEGPRRSTLHTSTRPYRETEDPQCASAREVRGSARPRTPESSARVRGPYEVGHADLAHTRNGSGELECADDPTYWDNLTEPTEEEEEPADA